MCHYVGPSVGLSVGNAFVFLAYKPIIWPFVTFQRSFKSFSRSFKSFSHSASYVITIYQHVALSVGLSVGNAFVFFSLKTNNLAISNILEVILVILKVRCKVTMSVHWLIGLSVGNAFVLLAYKPMIRPFLTLQRSFKSFSRAIKSVIGSFMSLCRPLVGLSVGNAFVFLACKPITWPFLMFQRSFKSFSRSIQSVVRSFKIFLLISQSFSQSSISQ